MKKIIWLWIAAFLITILAAVYQRLTGPTYPKRVKIELKGETYKMKLVRSATTGADAEVKLEIPNQSVHAKIHLRKFPTNDEWQVADFKREGDFLIAYLPQQPWAGKVEYYIDFLLDNDFVTIGKDKPIVTRFKGDVPTVILAPHIFFMFFSMLISTLAALMAVSKLGNQRFYGMIAFGILLIGGMILGPVVQKYAFGELWAGIPYGWDLTDNKTLIAFIGWSIAVAGNYKKERPWLTVAAAVLLLIIFSIPHSMFGSELNPTTGKIIQG